MKYIYINLSLICLCFFCSCFDKKKQDCQNILIPKENIRVILDSFIKENRQDNFIYELYINKVSPRDCEMILYAGEKSLTEKENTDYNQYSMASTISLGIKISIYSGIERYFSDSQKQNIFFNQVKDDGNSVLWAIRDSSGVVSSEKLEGGEYPFIVLPLKNAPNIFSAPIIKEGEGE
jgi:hypothetical protein